MSHTSADAHLLTAIYEAAKEARWTRAQVSEFVMTMYDKLPEEMTPREAQAVLTHLTGKLPAPVLPLL